MNKLSLLKPANLYQESGMARLSSPQQLDRYLSVASPANWFFLVTVLLLIGAAAAWSLKGAVTQTASGQGILIGGAGVVSVSAPAGGLVVALGVTAGDMVRAQQEIARIGSPVLAEQLRQAELALQVAQLEADRRLRMRAEIASVQSAAQDSQKLNLESEIGELEHETLFATEQVGVQQKLFDQGLTIKNTLICKRRSKDIPVSGWEWWLLGGGKRSHPKGARTSVVSQRGLSSGAICSSAAGDPGRRNQPARGIEAIRDGAQNDPEDAGVFVASWVPAQTGGETAEAGNVSGSH